MTRILALLLAVTVPSVAAAQTIYPLDRAEIMAGAKFDLKVEFPGAPQQGGVKVTINGADAATAAGKPATFVVKEDDGDHSAYWIRDAVLAPGKYTVEAVAGDNTASVTWEVIDSGIVWARADRASRMIVEASTMEDFSIVIQRVTVDATAESDFTAKALLENLPAGQDTFYRVAFENAAAPMIVGEPRVGRFRTAPDKPRDVSFVWSGDTCGGWGIDEARGGMRTYQTMLDNRPDFFVHCGDGIYAECPLGPETKLPNGEIWRNVLTEEKARVAETLGDFRGNYKYNLLDRNLRAFNAQVPTFAQWDDHEVTNDWYPGMPLHVGDADITDLAARGVRAFHEYMPTRQFAAERGRIYRKIAYGPSLDVFMLDMRSYRGPNGARREESYGEAAHFLGPAQVAWLKRELAASRATWKVISADLPIGVMNYDAAAQGDGPALGRELEIADLLRFIKHAGVRNTIWITADMHYTAAHHYSPDRAAFQDFEPFWEFMSGPIHAGTGGPAVLDNTFGPRAVYVNACSAEQGDDLAPCFGLQFFGHVAIDGITQVMTVTLKDVGDRNLWSIDLLPQQGGAAANLG